MLLKLCLTYTQTQFDCQHYVVDASRMYVHAQSSTAIFDSRS